MIPIRLHPESELKNSPTPGSFHQRIAGHHWLEMFDFDGRSGGVVVLQWNPGAQRWSHSGLVATGHYIDTSNYKYVKPCLLPEDIKSLVNEIKEGDIDELLRQLDMEARDIEFGINLNDPSTVKNLHIIMRSFLEKLTS